MDFKVSEKDLMLVGSLICLVSVIAFVVEIYTSEKFSLLKSIGELGTIAAGVGGLLAVIFLKRTLKTQEESLEEIRTSQRKEQLDKEFRFLCESVDTTIESLSYEEHCFAWIGVKPDSKVFVGFEVINYLSRLIVGEEWSSDPKLRDQTLSYLNVNLISFTCMNLIHLLKWLEANDNGSYQMMVANRYSIINGVFFSLLPIEYHVMRDRDEKWGYENMNSDTNLNLTYEDIYKLSKISRRLGLAESLQEMMETNEV